MEIKLYDGKVHITFRELSHSYWYNNPETGKKKRLTGVTGYISLLDKPALIRWAVNCAIDYIAENSEELYHNPTECLKNAGTAHDTIRKESARKGNEIHKWIEDYTKDGKVDMPTNDDTVTAIMGLYNWIKNEKVIESERVVFSKKNKFVGTLDLIIERKGKKYIVDIKTGNSNKLYPEMVLQLSAYKEAYEEEIEKIDGAIILSIDKETGEVTELPVETTKEDYKAFLNIKKVYEWKKECIKRLK